MKTFYNFSLCLAFALLPFSNVAEANSVQAQVIEVINCYSLKVLTDGETKVVRLAEVICPHTHLNPSLVKMKQSISFEK